MTTNTELVFRAICAFGDGEYSNFTNYSMRDAVREDALQDNIKFLKNIGAIEDCTVNGCARRYKVHHPIECPDFIFNPNLDFRMKMYLLDRYNINKNVGSFVAKSTFETKLQLIGTSSREIINNSKPIKRQIEVPDGMIVEKTQDGYKIKIKPTPIEIREKTYECKYCGDTKRENFGSLHTICKKCYNILDRNRRSYAERLYKVSKTNAQHCGYEHNLTMEYIQKLLEQQAYKCYYSGITFSNDKKDRFTYPTIDRIDSKLGYIEGNVCICTGFINSMKSNATIEQFKDLITKIYNNKDNF